MRQDRSKVEINLESLTSVSPFILSLDDDMTVAWTSEAALQRVETAAGMKASELLELRDPPEKISKALLAEKIGVRCKLALLNKNSETPLIGQWLRSSNGFVLLATPNAETVEDLSQFYFGDFPEGDHLVDLLVARDEAYHSLKEAGAAADALKRRNKELLESKRELDGKVDEIDEIDRQRRAILNMLKDIAESKRQLESMNTTLEDEITERNQAEAALRESELRLSTVLNSILTGVVIVDAQTHEIIDANPLATKLIGLAKEDIIGRLCHKFICPAEKGKCPISDLRQTVDQSERVLITADGKEIPILKTATPTSWKGHEYFVESFIDISERKKAEQTQNQLMEKLESANKELKDFAYVVSHDLKAPLRGVKVLVEWISTDYADKLDEEGKEQINLLISRVERMHNLIDGILQYSRVGRVKEEIVMVNFNELVRSIIDILAPPENITITIENELPTIKCEQTKIIQVFQNLLSNAIKYMDKSQGQIKVGCAEENCSWKFSVSDNGPGIEDQYFEKIFRMFQTLSPRDEFESTGVGLTVVKKIVESYKGKIWVESKVGQGSSFIFTLPKHEMPAEQIKV